VIPRWLAAPLAAIWVGCGPSLPQPEFTEHPLRAFEEVPYPPPAPLAEVVPRFDDGRAVWIDGYWVWRGRKYFWLRGGWVLPSNGARYAPWQLRYSAEGTLFFAQSNWYGPDGRPLRQPDTLLPARTPSNEVTPEDQLSH
jgi:hypothetical protein